VLKPSDDGLLRIIETGRSALFDPPVESTRYINFEDGNAEILVDLRNGRLRTEYLLQRPAIDLRADIPDDALPQWRAVKDGTHWTVREP
jgi:hypothetical protein